MINPDLIERAILLGVLSLLLLLVVIWLWNEYRRTARYNERLRTAALVGTGRVLAVEDLKETGESAGEMWLVLDIQIPGHPARQARRFFSCIPGTEPRPGELIPLRIHPDHPEDIYLERVT